VTKANEGSPEARAAKRVKGFTDLMWHLATFVIVNGFLWTIDIIKGDGLQWAFWPTIVWGIGLVFHIAAYLLSDSGSQSRRYQRILEEEKARDA